MRTLVALVLCLASISGCAHPSPPATSPSSTPRHAATRFACETYFGRTMVQTAIAPRAQDLGPTRTFLKLITLADLYFASPLIVQGVVGAAGSFAPAGHHRSAVRVVSVVRDESGRRVRDDASIDVDLPEHVARPGATLTLFVAPSSSGSDGPYHLIAEPVSLWYLDGSRLGTAYASRSVKTLRVGNGYYVKHICSRPLFSVRKAKNESDLERHVMRAFGIRSRAQHEYYAKLLRERSFALLEWAVLHDRGNPGAFPTHDCAARRSADCLSEAALRRELLVVG